MPVDIDWLYQLIASGNMTTLPAGASHGHFSPDLSQAVHVRPHSFIIKVRQITSIFLYSSSPLFKYLL